MNKAVCIFCAALITFTSAFAQSSVRAAYLEAEEAFVEKNFYKAVPLLESITDKNQYHLEAGLLLVDCYIELKNYTRAKMVLFRLVLYHPKNIAVRERIIKIALLEKRYQDAEESIAQLRSFDDKNAYCYYASARMLEDIGYNERALRQYELALKFDSGLKEAAFGAGNIYLEKGETAKAEEIFKRMKRLHPINEEVYYHLASFYRRTGKPQQALTECEKALHYYPRYEKAKNLKARILVDQKRYEDAIKILLDEKGNSSDTEKLYSAAILFEKNKKYEKSLEYFERYLRANPDAMFARAAYERVLFLADNPQSKRRDEAAMYYMPLISENLKDYDFRRAMIYIKRALRLSPLNIKVRKKYATLFDKSGYFERYIEQLQVLKDLLPEDDDIAFRIDYIKHKLKKLPSRRLGMRQYEMPGSSMKVAVFDNFTANTEAHESIEKAVSELTAHVLHQFPKITVIELYDKKYNFEEQVRAIKENDIDYFLKGSLEEDKEEDELSVSIDLVDARTRRPLQSYSAREGGKRKLIETLYYISKKVNDDIILFGRVLKVGGKNVIINIGKQSGVSNGMRFVVHRNDNPVFDFESKSIVSSSIDTASILKVEELDERVSICSVEDEGTLKFIRYMDYVSVKPQENEEEGSAGLAADG